MVATRSGADELAAAVFAEIETLKKDGPEDEYLEKVREGQIRKRETDLERNRFWATQLEWHEYNDLDLREILRYEDLVAAVTKTSVHEAARHYLNQDRYVHGVLYPEPNAAAEEPQEAAAAGGK